jgi:hypothetical protein
MTAKKKVRTTKSKPVAAVIRPSELAQAVSRLEKANHDLGISQECLKHATSRVEELEYEAREANRYLAEAKDAVGCDNNARQRALNEVRNLTYEYKNLGISTACCTDTFPNEKMC